MDTSKADTEPSSTSPVGSFRVTGVSGKGLGFVATSDITGGTQILAEAPLVTVSRRTSNKEALQREICQQLDGLTKEERQDYYSLSNVYHDEKLELGIARTNALPFGSHASEGGVFIQASRINHACNPNSQNTWNESIKKLTIYAARDIRQGEEITITYTDIFAKRSTRRAMLKRIFLFDCSCGLCSLPIERRDASDDRLEQMQRLDDKVEASFGAPLQALRTARQLLGLYEEENIVGASIPRTYYDAFNVAVANSDLARARVFAEKAFLTRKLVEGHNSPAVQRLEGLALDPSQHPGWGMSKDWETSLSDIPRAYNEEEFDRWLWRLSLQPASAITSFSDVEAFPIFDRLPNDNDVDLGHLQASDGFSYHPSRHWCFLGEIVEIENFLRLRLIVKDRAGKTVPVAFYTEGRGSELSPSLVKRGHTVAILYAEQHGFLDMTVGIRHETTEVLCIFRSSLDDLIRLSELVRQHTPAKTEERLCHACGKKPTGLKTCAACSFFWYCNKDCQKIGWNEKGHKAVCKKLRDTNMRSLLTKCWPNFDDYCHFEGH